MISVAANLCHPNCRKQIPLEKFQDIRFLSNILLYPLSLAYGLGSAVRNWLYNRQYFRSVRFDFPVISIGNLTAGGTGKTPHTEYLIFLLQYVYKVATLSRGYGRKSHGFLIAAPQSTANDIGDEPRQFKAKFPDTIVAVGEDRVLAIPRILQEQPDVDVILLDDAFQHRSVRPGLSVLLTEYNNLFTRDNLLPLGWLREAKSNYHRADIMVVTKCPAQLSEEERRAITEEIKPYPYQKIYFSSLQYGALYSFTDHAQPIELKGTETILLVCGIAKPEALMNYLKKKTKQVYLREFSDHHRFDNFDLDSIRQTYHNLGDTDKLIVITEKDAARLEPFRHWFLQNKIRIFVQPVAVKFLANDGEKFNADILQFMEFTRAKAANR